jgi:hypothetical protein
MSLTKRRSSESLSGECGGDVVARPPTVADVVSSEVELVALATSRAAFSVTNFPRFALRPGARFRPLNAGGFFAARRTPPLSLGGTANLAVLGGNLPPSGAHPRFKPFGASCAHLAVGLVARQNEQVARSHPDHVNRFR